MSQIIGAAVPRKEVTGLNRMTEKGLRDLCKKDKLYQTPRLNDVLYLHYQGYQYIECLEEYTELKCLWLECNAISEIEGLDKQSKLRCLFLQNNLIKRIDNLGSCPQLDTLNLSSNHIRMVENISSDILPVLNTLNISSNYLKDSLSLAHLVNCKTLAVLDLSNNRIDDILVVKIFEQMPCLKVLVLQGNPVVSRLPQYRKTLILACKELTYLDSRPVFPRDRACAEAWKKDGYEGERKENSRWNRADRKKMRDSVNYTIKLRNRHRPADQQDALISSTDSEAEDEANKRAENTRMKADVEYGCIDDIWSEVEGEEKDPNSSDSSGPESANEANGSPGEQKSSGRALEGRPKVLHESQQTEEENKDEESSKQKVQPEQQKGRRVLIEEIQLEDLDIKEEKDSNKEKAEPKNEDVKANEKEEDLKAVEEIKLEEKEFDDGKELSNEERKSNKAEFEKTKVNIIDEEIKEKSTTEENEREQISEMGQIAKEILSEEAQIQQITEDVNKEDIPDLIAEADNESELESVTGLEESTQTLAAVLKGNTEPTPEEIKQQCVTDMYKHYASEIFVKQPESIENIFEEETFKYEMDPKVCCVEPRKTSCDDEADKENNIVTKTKEQLDYEEECEEANQKVEHDMEELSNNLDVDLQELVQSVKQLHEEHKVVKSTKEEEEEYEKETKEKCVELTTVVRSLRIIEEFSVRRERISEDQKKQQENEQQLIADAKIEEGKEIEESQPENKEELDEQDVAFAKILDDALDDVPKRVFGAGCDIPSHQWQREECLRQLTLKEVHTELPDDDQFEVKLLSYRTSAEQAEEICDQINKKLAADEENLRELLQQLEDEVDVIEEVQSTLAENEILFKLPEPELGDVCRSLIDELIDELQYQEVINGQNMKSFDFGLIESDEEYSYSADPKVDAAVPFDLQDPAGGKSLRECLDAFGDFLSTVKERKRKDKTSKKMPSSSEKVQAAKKVLQSKMLPDVAPEDLDDELAKQNEKIKRRIAAMATRCFEKRENLEDSLEVIDNRLVIVKKNTGEIEDLPPPPALISDTESEDESDASDEEEEADYDTADDERQSTSEDKEQLTARSADSRRLWAKPCQPEPKELQQSDSLILEEIKEDENVPDQSLDQFYSLEARSAFNSLDCEFLEKLDLKKIIDTEGEITDEGMRDFMELQTSEKLEPQIQCGELDNKDEMLQDLIVRKKAQEERERKLRELTEIQKLNPTKQTTRSTEESNETPNQLPIPEAVESNSKLLLETEPQVHTVSNLQELSAEALRKMDIDPRDSPELKWEQEKREYQLKELPNPDQMGPIKLTLGACKIYERKSQLPEIPNSDEDPDVKINNESQSPTAADENPLEEKLTDKENEIKTEDKPLENVEDIEDKPSEQPTNIQILSSSIDDDIVSDTSTDYESGEDIPVVEPPKLPEGALNELFSNQFEDGLKLERESEEALRKELFSLPLRQWASQEQDLNVSQQSETPETLELYSSDTTIQNESDLAEEVSDTTSNSDWQSIQSEYDHNSSSSDTEKEEGAIGELAHNAKQQWAKISKKLHEFIGADDMKLLNEKEFNEDDGNALEDDELIEDLATLHEVDEDIYEECESELETTLVEMENVKSDSTDVGNKLGIKNESKVEDENKEGGIPNVSQNLKPTIRLEYFEAIDPDKDGADFDETAELKTEQIECNLEILNDDGDAVVKEINVNAKLTYEFP